MSIDVSASNDSRLGNLFLDPSLKSLEIGSQAWFEGQLAIIQSRRLIRNTYQEWYGTMLEDVASAPMGGEVLEIGSGAGYVKTLDPSVITSDIVPGNVDRIIDATTLPFRNDSLRGILCTHVFHHIPDIELFFGEVERTLVDGGVLTMIDVANTPFARFLFGKLHPEDFDAQTVDWTLDMRRPCGGANQALTWIVFRRDLRRFEQRFPTLRLECVDLLPWLGYLTSGGVTRRNFVPDWLARVIAPLDRWFSFSRPVFALHWHIRVRKVAGAEPDEKDRA